MKDVTNALVLVDSLLKSGDKLVVVGLFMPGCGDCRDLHLKLCQLAEQNPGIQYLHVDPEEHKLMCYGLNARVLPLFGFYRSAHGWLCSFNCSIAMIKEFRDALAKHSLDWCSLVPIKRLEEKELTLLAANKDLSFKLPIQLPTPSVPADNDRVSVGFAKSHSNLPYCILLRPSESFRKNEEQEKTSVSR